MREVVAIQEKRNKWQIFAVVSMSNLVVAFTTNSLLLALPIMATEFSVSQSTVSWLAIVYSLIPCCTMLIFGRTAELFGFKRQFKAGFLFFGAVSLAAPLLSNSISMLIFFRCLQGLSNSLMISITYAIVSRAFPENERGKAIGVNAMFVSVGMAAGPTIGGLLLTYFSWHALFYFSIPFCLIGLWATSRCLPDDDLSNKERGHMDVLGAALLSISLGAIVIGLNLGESWGFNSRSFICCIVVGAVCLYCFIRHETVSISPLMNLSFFRNKTFALGNMINLLLYLIQQMISFLMPFYLINILLLGADTAGLIMLSMPILMMICSPIGGSLADKKGTRFPSGIGLTLYFAGCLVMGLFGETMAFAVAMVVLLLIGAGNGFSVAAINSAVIVAVPSESVGVASGMTTTMRTLGQSGGVLCASMILSLRQPVYGYISSGEAYLLAQRDAYYFGMILAALAIVLIWLLPRQSATRP